MNCKFITSRPRGNCSLKKLYHSRVFRQLLSFYSTKQKSKLVEDEWCGVVGLEIHAQINSESKLFSAAGTDFTSPVNQNVSFFDAAIPGTLPVLNRRCVEAGVLTALALNCTLNPVSGFDRKHYFYADLPAGYQITQQRDPLARGGSLTFPVFTQKVHKAPYSRTARLIQLQLEQDSGKSLHDPTFNRSLIDLNRAGVPLMELVFAPDLSDGHQAAALVRELSLILTRLGTCLCKMEEGGLRVDANVSVHKRGAPLGVRSEVKNIGSVRGVARAVDYEIERQKRLLAAGGRVVNETRNWDAENDRTVPMRDKEVQQDYRFMPEPNLLPLRLDVEGAGDACRVSVPAATARLQDTELPAQTRRRLHERHGLPETLTMRLVDEPPLLRLFEAVLSSGTGRSALMVANLLIMDLMTLVNKELCHLGASRPSSGDIGEIVDLLQAKKINLTTARKVLSTVATEGVEGGGESASDIVTRLDQWLVTDPLVIRAECQAALDSNPDIVLSYRKGKTNVFKALMGDIAKRSKNRIDMSEVAKQLEDMLKKD